MSDSLKRHLDKFSAIADLVSEMAAAALTLERELLHAKASGWPPGAPARNAKASGRLPSRNAKASGRPRARNAKASGRSRPVAGALTDSLTL